MIPIISAAAGVVAGMLLGGCSPRSDDLNELLVKRNAQLETQLSGTQSTLTALAVSVVIMAAGLGASLYQHRKGARRGKTRSSAQAGR